MIGLIQKNYALNTIRYQFLLENGDEHECTITDTYAYDDYESEVYLCEQNKKFMDKLELISEEGVRFFTRKVISYKIIWKHVKYLKIIEATYKDYKRILIVEDDIDDE